MMRSVQRPRACPLSVKGSGCVVQRDVRAQLDHPDDKAFMRIEAGGATTPLRTRRQLADLRPRNPADRTRYANAKSGRRLPRRHGLAQYAERFCDQYRRIEAVAKIGDSFRVLDLKEVATRASVSTATTIKALYESADAFDYLP